MRGESLNQVPEFYRDVIERLLLDSSDVELFASLRNWTIDELSRIIEIALDILFIQEEAAGVALSVVMSDEHRVVMQRVLIDGDQLDLVSRELGYSVETVRRLDKEVREILLPGSLDLAAAVVEMDPAEREVFCGIFFDGESFGSIASRLGLAADVVGSLWDSAIRRMSEASREDET